MKTQKHSTLLGAFAVARRLGISPGWLRIEARAGRLPHIDAGGTLLFDLAAVRGALAERAATERGGIQT